MDIQLKLNWNLPYFLERLYSIAGMIKTIEPKRKGFNMSELSYLNALGNILYNPESIREGRNGKVYSTFDGKIVYSDVGNRFPLFTSKFVHFRSVVTELLWFLSGDTNIKYLKDHNVRIWDEWADENGDLGPVYGAQWRNWSVRRNATDEPVKGVNPLESVSVDQIQRLMDGLVKDPFSRRHIVSAWNPSDVGSMALPPCHTFFQCYVDNEETLHLKLYQRSADMFLGVPFNVASYSLLLILLARHTGYKPGRFIHDFGDMHIYDNHVDAVKTILTRKPTGYPTLVIKDKDSIFDYTPEDIYVENYNHLGKIPAPVSK